MRPKLDCVMIIDDNDADNFLHRLTIEKCAVTRQVVAYEDAVEALELISNHDLMPDLIYLDINMPGMDGWGFLEALDALPILPKQPVVLAMLATSLSPTDEQRADKCNQLDGFTNKPLTQETVLKTIIQHFES